MRVLILAILLGAVGCSPQHPAVTIRALAPTGDAVGYKPQPIWEFAITNAGGCDVLWRSSVDVKGGEPGDYSNAGGHIEWPVGILAPGESLFTDMIVPAHTGSVWRASIEFWRISPQDLKEAQAKAAKFPEIGVFGFCSYPQNKKDIYQYDDEWHH